MFLHISILLSLLLCTVNKSMDLEKQSSHPQNSSSSSRIVGISLFGKRMSVNLVTTLIFARPIFVITWIWMYHIFTVYAKEIRPVKRKDKVVQQLKIPACFQTRKYLQKYIWTKKIEHLVIRLGTFWRVAGCTELTYVLLLLPVKPVTIQLQPN